MFCPWAKQKYVNKKGDNVTNPDEIMNVKDTVLKVVREKPFTRESYWQLFFEVNAEYTFIDENGMGKHPASISGRGGYYFPMAYVKHIISPETIGRAYRLLKADDPSLRPRSEIEEERRMRECEMRDINIHWQPQRQKGTQSLLIPEV